tara:strand:- start:2397 stop:3533 length:1137 start_codon:yes stop_codon:yes gene_type:complete
VSIEKRFSAFSPTKVFFGAGERNQLISLLREEKWARACIVCDHALLEQPLIAQLIRELRDTCQQATMISCDIQEPTYASLEAKRRHLVPAEPEVIIGIGGGSALDMAKAMAVLANNLEPAITYRGFDQMTHPTLPIIAVPTTAGTGSEITPNASFVDEASKFKMGINGDAVRPRYAVLDPELTLSCPAAPTLSAAVDSLVHATEAFVAKKTNPWARLFAFNGFNLVIEALPSLMKRLDDIALRTDVMLGAHYSAMALMHSGTGPAAALSYPLGVHHKVPHGIGGGIFLPHVVKKNIDLGYEGYRDLWRGCVTANDFCRKMTECWTRLKVPTHLTRVAPDISRPLMIADTLKLSGALEQNPVPFGETEIGEVLNVLRVS